MGNFQAVPWHYFVDHVRMNINPLAADDHMKEIIQQLQLMGEVDRVDIEALCFIYLANFTIAGCLLERREVFRHYYFGPSMDLCEHLWPLFVTPVCISDKVSRIWIKK
jgi:hypothetical protein